MQPPGAMDRVEPVRDLLDDARHPRRRQGGEVSGEIAHRSAANQRQHEEDPLALCHRRPRRRDMRMHDPGPRLAGDPHAPMRGGVPHPLPAHQLSCPPRPVAAVAQEPDLALAALSDQLDEFIPTREDVRHPAEASHHRPM